MSRNYWQIYAIMFGFGMVIFAVMVVTSLAKASRGGVRERAEFLDSLPKFFFWTPVMSVIPACNSPNRSGRGSAAKRTAR